VPTTKEQQEFIQGIQESRKRKVEKEIIDTSYKPKSPGGFRHDWLHMLDIFFQLNLDRAEKCGFDFNKESMERINRAFSELRNAIAEGGVRATPALHHDGNVIYIGARPVA
jgi:hypothetical protein